MTTKHGQSAECIRSFVPVLWQPRGEPLAAAAVGATGAAASALARRLLSLEDAALAALTGVCGSELLLLLGAEKALPWVDGAVYLGRDHGAPGVLLSTTHAPSVPLPLLVRALRGKFPAVDLPFAVLGGPAGPLLVPLAAARPVTRQALLRWRERSA